MKSCKARTRSESSWSAFRVPMAHASRLAWDSREGPPARCRRGIDADRENDGTVSKEVSIEIPLFRDGRLAGGRGTVVRLRDGDLRGLHTGWRPPPTIRRRGACPKSGGSGAAQQACASAAGARRHEQYATALPGARPVRGAKPPGSSYSRRRRDMARSMSRWSFFSRSRSRLSCSLRPRASAISIFTRAPRK